MQQLRLKASSLYNLEKEDNPLAPVKSPPIDWTASATGQSPGVVGPMTEHDAVNLMLTAAGETPLASLLDDTRNADAIQARQTLREVSREVQLEGWHFNTERDVTLLPSPEGEIAVPANAIRVDVEPHNVAAYSNTDIIQRGNRLYDLRGHTYTFTEGIPVVVTYFLPFDQLPDSARYYIATKAARRFRMNVTGGDDGASSVSQADEARARATLVREHLGGVDLSFISPHRNTVIGRTSIGRVLGRRL